MKETLPAPLMFRCSKSLVKDDATIGVPIFLISRQAAARNGTGTTDAIDWRPVIRNARGRDYADGAGVSHANPRHSVLRASRSLNLVYQAHTLC